MLFDKALVDFRGESGGRGGHGTFLWNDGLYRIRTSGVCKCRRARASAWRHPRVRKELRRAAAVATLAVSADLLVPLERSTWNVEQDAAPEVQGACGLVQLTCPHLRAFLEGRPACQCETRARPAAIVAATPSRSG
jgi:hypothetical protein